MGRDPYRSWCRTDQKMQNFVDVLRARLKTRWNAVKMPWPLARLRVACFGLVCVTDGASQDKREGSPWGRLYCCSGSASLARVTPLFLCYLKLSCVSKTLYESSLESYAIAAV